MDEYCQHMNFYFIIFFIFQIGMRPNQLPYNVNLWIFYNTCIYQQRQIINQHLKCILHCISIKYRYLTLMTVCQSIDRHTTKQLGLVYVKYHPNTRVGFQTIKQRFYLCSWAMCKIYRTNQCPSNTCT